MIRRPPRSTPFPYTPLSRSSHARSVVARVDDQGTSGHRVMTAGYQRPEPTAHGGMGLWLARHMADVVHVDAGARSEEHTSELQSRQYLVCRLLLEKKKKHCV